MGSFKHDVALDSVEWPQYPKAMRVSLVQMVDVVLPTILSHEGRRQMASVFALLESPGKR